MSDGEIFPHALSLTCCSLWLSFPYVFACLTEYLHTSGWRQSLRLVSRTLAQLPKAAGPACVSEQHFIPVPKGLCGAVCSISSSKVSQAQPNEKKRTTFTLPNFYQEGSS